jgi:hypothetical protein
MIYGIGYLTFPISRQYNVMMRREFGMKQSGLIKILPQHSPGGTEEYCIKHVRIAGVLAKIQTEHLQNTSIECYLYINLFNL